MKGMLIPVDGEPRAIDIQEDAYGSILRDLQRLVHGYVEPFDALFGEEVCLYVNENGMYECQPNRAGIATKRMEDDGYASPSDPTRSVREGEPYNVLYGDIVAVGFDPETGSSRDLTDEEAALVGDYFTRVSAPGSGSGTLGAVRAVSPALDPADPTVIALPGWFTSRLSL